MPRSRSFLSSAAVLLVAVFSACCLLPRESLGFGGVYQESDPNEPFATVGIDGSEKVNAEVAKPYSSEMDIYGSGMMEHDGHVGQLLATLEDLQIAPLSVV